MHYIWVMILGVLLDLLLGDPQGWYHPVRLMGWWIAVWTRIIRSCLPKTRTGEYIGGIGLVVITLLASGGVPFLLLWGAGVIHPHLRFVLEVWFCYRLLAARSLQKESMEVWKQVAAGNLSGARKAVSMIVGRDTAQLDEAGVIRAAVETVGENTSDGVIAPLFYMALGGPVLGFIYKAVNTMDSMVAYKNEEFRYFGTGAARLDDVANFLPSRLAALFMVVMSQPLGFSGRRAFQIWRRDRYNHRSPNSAQTEAVLAGALGIQLAGDAWYFGKLVEKPYIGENIRAVEPDDIKRANRLMFGASILALAVFGLIRALLVSML